MTPGSFGGGGGGGSSDTTTPDLTGQSLKSKLFVCLGQGRIQDFNINDGHRSYDGDQGQLVLTTLL